MISTLIKKHFSYGVSLLFERSIPLVLLPFYTHAFSTVDFGIYSVFIAFWAIMTFLYTLGLENGLLKFLQDRNRVSIEGTLFLTILTASLMCTLLIVCIANPLSLLFFNTPMYAIHFRILAVLLLMDAMVRCIIFRLLGDQRTRTYFSLSIFKGIVLLGANLLFVVWFRWGLYGIWMATFFPSLFILIYFLMTDFVAIRWSFDRSQLGRLWSYGFPLMISSVLLTILHSFDRFMVQHWMGAEATGFYSVAYRLAFVLQMSIVAFNMGGIPFLSEQKKSDDDISILFHKMLVYMTGFTLALALLIGLWIPRFVSISIGGFSLIPASYQQAFPLIPMILLAYTFFAIYNGIGFLFYHHEKTSYFIRSASIGVILNVAANAVLIPRFGLWGAAFATALAFAVMAVLMHFWAMRLFPIRCAWRSILILTAWIYCLLVFAQKGMFSILPQILITLAGLLSITFWIGIQMRRRKEANA